MFDVVALGELLIDFTPSGKSENGNMLFERNPGGAPANVLAALAKLGNKTGFIGKVGEDQFGYFLRSILNDINIDTTGLVTSKEVNTTLAFVHLDENGDRSFSFYRKPGADMMLTEKDINYELIKTSKIFHFGSVSMTDEPSRTATLKAADYARKNKVLVSYDPNLRPPLWCDLDTAKRIIIDGLKFTDVLKVSEEELVFLTGIKDLSEGSEYLSRQNDIKLIFVTRGPKGCFFRFGNNTGFKPAYDVKTIDTTGAGDAFWGGILHQLIKRGNDSSCLTIKDIEEIADFGNAAGSLATTRRGAIPAMPSLYEIEACRNTVRKIGINKE